MLDTLPGEWAHLAMTLVCATGIAGCSSRPPYASVESTADGPVAFDLRLMVNDHGVGSVMIMTSSGALRLIVDTGADQAILLREDSPAVEGLERVGTMMKWYANGQLDRAPVMRIEEVRLGPLRFSDVRAPLEKTEFPDFMAGDGVLGRGLLGQMTLDIDFPGGRLGVLPAGVLPDDFNEEDWIEVELSSYKNGPVVPVEIDDSSRTLHMVMDTGAIAAGPDGLYGTIELPGDLQPESEGVAGLPVYRAWSVRIGGSELGPMNFYVIRHPQPPGTQGFLGNVLYQRRRVLIVPELKKVYLRRVSQ